MRKILQLSDLHLVKSGSILRGLDPEKRLRECLSDIQQNHRDASALVITGDLVDEAEPEAYELLKRILGEYALPPVHLTVGNHDDRRHFGEVFPSSVDPGTRFAQRSISLGDHVGLLMDTWEFGTHAGSLCAERLAWLSETLAADQRPALLFMHHVPFRVGLKWLDRLPMKNEEELANALEPFRDRIRHLFFGHLHRNVSGAWRGFPYTVLASSAVHHGMLDFQSEMSRPMLLDPFYSVILVDGHNIIVHAKQVSENYSEIDYGPSIPPRHVA